MGSLKKNFSYQIAYRILTVITPLITSPIVSRALGADNLGVYSATQAFANYFMFAAMLGIEKYGQRTIASANNEVERKRLFWEIYTVQLISSSLAIVVYYGLVLIIAGNRMQVMLVQGLWVISCLLDISWFFFGVEEFKVTVTRNFIIKICTVVFVVAFIRKPSDLIVYSLVMAGGTTLSQIILWFSLFRRFQIQKSDWKSVIKHVSPIFHLFIPVIALSVYHIMDKTMLDILSTEANVGWYYAVDKIVYIPLGLILAIGTVMLTRVSYVLSNESKRKASELLNKSVELTMFMTCAVGFGIAAICNEFIPFFFGPGYEPCVQLMYMFLPVLLIKALGDVVRTQYLIAAKKDNIYTAAVISGAVTNVICNMLFIPKLGAKGAVLGTLVAELVVLIVQIGGAIKDIPFIKFFVNSSPYIIIGAIMTFIVRVAVLPFRSNTILLQLLFMVIVGAISYMCMCAVFWAIKQDSIFSPYLKKIQRLWR